MRGVERRPRTGSDKTDNSLLVQEEHWGKAGVGGVKSEQGRGGTREEGEGRK